MAIQTSKDTIFSLTTNTIQYVFAIDKNGLLQHLYWGSIVSDTEDFSPEIITDLCQLATAKDITPEEFSWLGGLRYKSTAARVKFPDAVRDLQLQYSHHQILNANELVLFLKDEVYDFVIELHYKVHEKFDVIERWAEYVYNGNDCLVIDQAASAVLNIPETDLHLTNTFGHWSAEHRFYRSPLPYGKTIMESRRGMTGHNSSPYVVLDHNATETAGEVYYAALQYSGNFKIEIEKTEFGYTQIVLGINDFDFEYTLQKGDRLKAPAVFLGYSAAGFGQMSRTMHHFARTLLLPGWSDNAVKKIVYNSWEATGFNFDDKQQIALAKIAAELGVETFMVDDGWFGKRNSDTAGLGDWYVNPDKFPNGLKPLITEVNNLGMDFGIWVEPEMVNPDSDLFRAHPDWIYHFDSRTPTQARNQYVLNMTREDVQEYIFTALDNLFTENKIRFVKWDMNRPFTEPGAKNLLNEKSLWFLHTQAVFSIVDRLREKHPEVEIQACSSGGGRIDYGALSHFHEFLLSDNTNSVDTLTMKDGYSFMYPFTALRDWVADDHTTSGEHAGITRHVPLSFRFDVAMLGMSVIGGNLLEYTDEKKELLRSKIAAYKNIRHVIQQGDVYRLKRLHEDRMQVFQFVYRDESVVLFFLPHSQFTEKKHRIKLEGLDPIARYEYVIGGEKVGVKSGSYLMNYGLFIEAQGDYFSAMIQLRGV